jgi:anti-sigma regulatory factor (Ser/Thr protein kinase)
MTEKQPPDIEFDFDHDLEAPRRARQALQPLFIDDGDPISDAVELAASELVTNVVIHTSDGGSLRAWDVTPHDPLRLEVEDFDATPPLPKTPSVEGGRGLLIVDNVADAWGVEPTGQGKVVWVEFNRPESEPETQP